MNIRIKKRTQNEWLILLLFVGPFVLAPLTQFLNLPGALKYTMDMAWLLLIPTLFFPDNRIEEDAKILLLWIFAFFGYTLINYAFNFQSIFYYLWGFRNNFRGFILFFAVIYCLKDTQIENAFSFLYKIFYLNAVIMLFQFLFLGYKQDNLGGIFGVESGCNAYQNVFFCIILVHSYLNFCEGHESAKRFILKSMLLLILAALAELKFFYIEFVFLMVTMSLTTKFSWKKVLMIALSIVIFAAGFYVFIQVFPDIDLSVDGLLEYASSDKGYTSSGDFNRLHFISRANKDYLDSIQKQVMGLGLGNCDYATGIELLSSPFYYANEHTHYGWMSTSFTYLENGWIGLIFFFGFFVMILVHSFIKFLSKRGNRLYNLMGVFFAIVAIMNGFYNISLRTEVGYMMYFVLAVPYIRKADQQDDAITDV